MYISERSETCSESELTSRQRTVYSRQCLLPYSRW